jgi:hypothetical protein
MKKYSFIRIKQDEHKPYQVNIIAEVEENNYYYTDIIGRFCFYDGEGYITLENGTRKKYKRFSAMLNLIYTIDPVASMDTSLIEEVKQEAKKVNSTQQTEDTERQVEDTTNYTIKNNNTIQQETETSYTAYNRTFPTYEQAYQYCVECDLDPSMIEQVEPITALPDKNNATTEQPETFHLYKHTFNTYKEAYDYAIKNNITVSMIISSKANITNERLQELEREYLFNKHHMAYSDMVEYLNHLQTIPFTIDSKERIDKLKNMIERYKRKQERIKQEEEVLQQMNKEINMMLQDMYKKGMTKRVIGNIITEYSYNNQPIYKWYSGISTKQMYNELLEVYNKHFS